jgi:DNA-directed RNA polymerase specialized sigma24 family protein
MTGFVVNKLGNNKANYEGLEPVDFVFQLFEKILTGIKNWPSDRVDFETFIFKSLQNEVWQHYQKLKRKNKEADDKDGVDESYLLDIPVIVEEVGYENTIIEEIDYPKNKDDFIKLLKESGATEMEFWIFECWCDGISKPQEISDLLEIDIKTIYNAIKRLHKRRKKILQNKL